MSCSDNSGEFIWRVRYGRKFVLYGVRVMSMRRIGLVIALVFLVLSTFLFSLSRGWQIGVADVEQKAVQELMRHVDDEEGYLVHRISYMYDSPRCLIDGDSRLLSGMFRACGSWIVTFKRSSDADIKSWSVVVKDCWPWQIDLL